MTPEAAAAIVIAPEPFVIVIPVPAVSVAFANVLPVVLPTSFLEYFLHFGFD